MITITGNFEQLTGAGTGSVRFDLVNFGANAPRIAGTGVIVNTSYTSQTAASFSVSIFGNDAITPANTYYMVTLFDANGHIVTETPYSFTGAGPYDLSTAAPINPVPPTVVGNAVLQNPVADQTIANYALTIQGGIHIGNTNTLTINPALTASRTCFVPDANSTLVVSSAASAHNFAIGINATGVIQYAQPAFSDLSGNIAVSQMNSGTNASSSTFWRGDGTWAKSAATALDVNQTAHGFSVGQAIYYNGTAWALAEANASSTLGLGIVSAVADGNNFTVAFAGSISGLAGLTAGQYYYVSDAVAGTLTSTEPTTAGSYSNPILFALTTTSGIVLPFRPSAIAQAASNQNANVIYAGPASGSPAIPGFRSMVTADLPSKSAKALVVTSGTAGAITGNGAAQNIFSVTIPANTITTGQAIRVWATWNHSTGTAVVNYTMTLNGQATAGFGGALAGVWMVENTIFATAATTGQTLSLPVNSSSIVGTGNGAVTGLNWAASQTLAVTFSVANTDQVTPIYLYVEILQ